MYPSSVKITALSVNPKIFKDKLMEIGFKTPKIRINIIAIKDIIPMFLSFSFFKYPYETKDKYKIVKRTVIPVIAMCIVF